VLFRSVLEVSLFSVLLLCFLFLSHPPPFSPLFSSSNRILARYSPVLVFFPFLDRRIQATLLRVFFPLPVLVPFFAPHKIPDAPVPRPATHRHTNFNFRKPSYSEGADFTFLFRLGPRFNSIDLESRWTPVHLVAFFCPLPTFLRIFNY